jgi:cytidine deaminase
MGAYGPTADVLVDLHGTVRKVRAADLMPNPWQFPRENDWFVQDPSLGAAP